jgi:hypothetical protein
VLYAGNAPLPLPQKCYLLIFRCRYGDGENDDQVLESSAKPGRQKVVHGKIGSQFFTEVDVKGKGRFKGLKNVRLPERK